MSRILQALQQRQGNGHHEGTDPTTKSGDLFTEQAALLGSSKFSKGKVEPLFGTRGVTETDRAVVACNDYLRMGAGRTITELHREFAASKERGQTQKEMMRPLSEEEKDIWRNNPSDSSAKIAAAQKNKHDLV